MKQGRKRFAFKYNFYRLWFMVLARELPLYRL